MHSKQRSAYSSDVVCYRFPTSQDRGQHRNVMGPCRVASQTLVTGAAAISSSTIGFS